MSKEIPEPADLVEWCVATKTMEGQTESGDHHLVCFNEAGILVAVVDGLGHGSEAAEAARKAVDTMNRYSQEAAIALVSRCHEALKRTRGVVMNIAAFNWRCNLMTWLGVGNVEGVLLRADNEMQPARESIMHMGGVVGFQFPSLRAVVVPVFPGDTLVFATDGIRGEFVDNLVISTPQTMANRICEKYYKGNDDALVLVACYKGLAQ